MTFNEEEVTILKKMFRYAYVSEYGASQNLNQGFGYWSLRKDKEGRIIISSSTPMDVDCDDGSVGSYSESRKVYETFEELVNTHK